MVVAGYDPGLEAGTWGIGALAGGLQDGYELQNHVSLLFSSRVLINQQSSIVRRLSRCESFEETHFDRIEFSWLGAGFGGLNVKADRGSRTSWPLAFASSCLALRAPATTPRPDSTNAWPREPALDPSRGISFRA